jgi:hypothetical protein
VGSGASDSVFNKTLADKVDFGLVDAYANCGGNGTAFLDFAGYNADSKSFVYLQFTATSDADVEAGARLLTSLTLDYTKVPEPTTAQTEPDFSLP